MTDIDILNRIALLFEFVAQSDLNYQERQIVDMLVNGGYMRIDTQSGFPVCRIT